MGDIVGSPTTLSVDVDGMDVCVARGVSLGGKVAVTKSGIAVNAFLLEMLTPQPVQAIVTAIRRVIFIRCTSLLYPKISCVGLYKWMRIKKPLSKRFWCPRAGSNCGPRLRRPILYPLSYGGELTEFYHRVYWLLSKMKKG